MVHSAVRSRDGRRKGGAPAVGNGGCWQFWRVCPHLNPTDGALNPSAGAQAAEVASQASEPFFLNYWMQNTHGPFEVPPQYVT